MKKITVPHVPVEKNYIFTEGINYFETKDVSIFGTGDKDTLIKLQNLKLVGKWLNLAAGDGRYNTFLLKKVDSLVASDIDEGALSKLWMNTPLKLRPKLETKVFDITKSFPFKSEVFDGVFCTGTLHLFPNKILKQILHEIHRVVKKNGRIILDFATDIKRIKLDGSLLTFPNETSYTLQEGEQLLKDDFKTYSLQLFQLNLPAEKVKADIEYTFSCNYIFCIGNKK